MGKPIRVLIADDHAIVRKGITALLVTEPDISVVGEAEDGRLAIIQARTLRPDVILMDLVMPKLDGIQAIRQITAERPDSRILVLTSFAADSKVFPAIKAGEYEFYEHEMLKKRGRVKELPWLQLNKAHLEGKLLAIPSREEIPVTFDESLIVEFYSR